MQQIRQLFEHANHQIWYVYVERHLRHVGNYRHNVVGRASAAAAVRSQAAVCDVQKIAAQLFDYVSAYGFERIAARRQRVLDQIESGHMIVDQIHAFQIVQNSRYEHGLIAYRLICNVARR